ncbi:STAS domain-containing protein [Mangrovimonas sp. YM274]|uniref:STAS domain-containing protein n=1 Tax=Mangrovimonas sp. YM274 TaxID=3070660 RepID=UPI0027DCDAA2|nr:STAS domain-containing protein [Mangrovimonas sp. YM274]WMI68570.1 STAS domain-containing protein [Mangrovimonas sp. YM274]
MSLKITSYNNFFKVKGVLTKRTVHLFHSEFHNVFERINAMTLSIEGVEEIDKYGIQALLKLHNEALDKQKSLSIIGMGCDSLYNHFKSEQSAVA